MKDPTVLVFREISVSAMNSYDEEEKDNKHHGNMRINFIEPFISSATVYFHFTRHFHALFYFILVTPPCFFYT